MKSFGRALRALPLAGMLILAGCGGGSPSAAEKPPVQSPGIQIGEPTPGAFDSAAHVRQAAGAACTDYRNRLHLIDNKYVFWDRAGNCADASYSQSLMGADPAAPLCSAGDSIAGPFVRCTDDSVRALFDIMRKNLDASDLGLGPSHSVKPIEMPGKPGSSVDFETVAQDSFSGVAAPKNLLITSAAALEQAWREHGANASPAPAMPKIDFTTHMVIALFAGNRSACHEFEVSRVSAVTRAGASDLARDMLVEYIDRDISPMTICVAAVTSPMQMIKVPLSTMGVVFKRLDAEFLDFTTLHQTNYSRPMGFTAGNLVIKDAASFEREFEARRNGDTVKPVVDFSRQMVIAVFSTGSDGCSSSGVSKIYRSNGKLVVSIVQSRPAPGQMIACTQAITFPAHWVVIDRSDAAVEFQTQIRYYRLG